MLNYLSSVFDSGYLLTLMNWGQHITQRLATSGETCRGPSITWKRYSFIKSTTDLCSVEGWAPGPLKHVLVDVAVVASQDRVQFAVVVVEGVDQGHGVGSELRQQLLDTHRNLQHLGHAQQPGLRENRPGRGWKTQKKCKLIYRLLLSKN